MLVIDGGTRENGNTEALTDLIIKDVECEHIFLKKKHILPIVDQRHDPSGFQTVDDDYLSVVKTMLNHDIILFSTPVYWYGMSGLMKNFIDRWSESLRDSSLSFRARMAVKRALVVVVGGDEPRIKALPLIIQFQHIFNFLGTSFEGYVIGRGDKPGDIFQDSEAIHQANFYNQKLKNLRRPSKPS